MGMREFETMSHGELIEQHRELIEYRVEERSVGQVTPNLLAQIEAVEEELEYRMEDIVDCTIAVFNHIAEYDDGVSITKIESETDIMMSNIIRAMSYLINTGAIYAPDGIHYVVTDETEEEEESTIQYIREQMKYSRSE